MFYKNNTNWNLLAKYLAGEAGPEEIDALEVWRKAKPSNNELFQQLKSDWKNMDRMNVRFDVDNAWNKLNNRIANENHETAPKLTVAEPAAKKSWVTYPMRIAAAILVLALLGITIYTLSNRIATVRIIASADEKGKVVELPDGSVVTLNADTRLEYAKKFGSGNREVVLTGEAFFDVKHNQSMPFIIHAGDARVRVLGTSFNVNMRKEKNEVEVYVATGLVELSEDNNSNNRQLIQPGNIGIFNKNEISIAHTTDNNSMAWKTGKLTFDDTPLSKAVSLLGEYYHVNIVMKGSGIDTIKINGSYQNDPLDRILEVIGHHNPELTIAKTGDTIYLTQN